jgi:hypothetical protein
VLAGLMGAASLLQPRGASIVVLAAALLQIVDLYPQWSKAADRYGLREVGSEWETELVSDFWGTAVGCYGEFRIHPTRNKPDGYESVAYLAATHSRTTDAVYHSRLDQSAVQELNSRIDRQIAVARPDPNALYFLEDGSAIAAKISGLDPDDLVVRVDGFNVLIPDGISCFGEEIVDKELDLDALIEERSRLSESPVASASTDRVHLMDGWYGAEPEHVWSKAPIARLALVLNQPITQPATLELGLRGVISALQPSIQIGVSLGDRQPQTILVDEWSESVRIDLSPESARASSGHDQILVVQLENQTRRPPVDVGLGTDSRPLGVGFTGARVVESDSGRRASGADGS